MIIVHVQSIAGHISVPIDSSTFGPLPVAKYSQNSSDPSPRMSNIPLKECCSCQIESLIDYSGGGDKLRIQLSQPHFNLRVA